MNINILKQLKQNEKLIKEAKSKLVSAAEKHPEHENN